MDESTSFSCDEAVAESDHVLNSRMVRRVYLITLSQADMEVVPSRETFSRIVLEAFANAAHGGNCSVLQRVCCKEAHRLTAGIHYHMAVKLSKHRRWLTVRNYIEDEYGLKVNFSDRHQNYYTAWKYATEEDGEALHSENHPDLASIGEPTTANASHATCRVHGDGGTAKQKCKTLTVFDILQLAVAKGIKTRLQLLALANRQKREGKLTWRNLLPITV